eukprot:1141277-Pelagomonas_calceolata.AAC.4
MTAHHESATHAVLSTLLRLPNPSLTRAWVVNTLLELAFSAPHPALRAGKVVIHITPGKFPAFSGKVR